MIRALIIDDEPEAAHYLHHKLTELSAAVNIIGIAHTTKEAEVLVRDMHPDAVFLDIDMPNENAFQFLERISPCHFEVVFVTAYDQYAVRAFRLNAIDYILKPVDPDELQKAVEKLREKISFRQRIEGVPVSDLSVLPMLHERAEPEQIILRSNNVIEIVLFKNILFVEAMRSYSKIAFISGGKEKSLVMSHPITEYEELLPDSLFFRVHRSYLVNCRYVHQIQKEEQIFVLLQNQVRIPVGRRRYIQLVSFLKSINFHGS